MNTTTTTSRPMPTAPPVVIEARVPRPLTNDERLKIVRDKIAKRRAFLAEQERPATAKSLNRLAARKTTHRHGVRRDLPTASPDNNGFGKERKPGRPPSERAIATMRRDWAKWGTAPNPAGPPAHATRRGVTVAGSSGDSNSSGGGN
jgi:hypothetical protein